MKKITAKDIAQLCGVSQATVSYVINNKQGKVISEEVRNLILDTTKKMNYYPNNTARRMRLSKSMSIGLVVGANFVNLTFHTILKGIKRCADQCGYTITLLTDGEHDGENEIQMANQFISYFRSNTIDGIIFMFYEINDEVLNILHENGIPYVLVSETGITAKNLNITTGLDSVIDQCVDYCKEHELERISYYCFNHKSHYTTAVYKHHVFEQRMEEIYPLGRIETTQFSVSDSDEELQNLIGSSLPSTDIVITASPRLTFLTQGVIMKKELMIPQRVKLISLNHSKMFDLVYPTITHLEIPLVQMGEYATSYLIDTISGKQTQTAQFLCSLKQGMSTLS